jgi:hypothetical protein
MGRSPKLTKLEQETIILYNQEEDTCSCYTYDPKLMKQLDKLCAKSSDATLKNDTYGSRTYIFPKAWIKVQIPKVVTEEKRQKLAHLARQNFGKNTKTETE